MNPNPRITQQITAPRREGAIETIERASVGDWSPTAGNDRLSRAARHGSLTMANPKPALAREVDLDQRQVVGAFAAPVLSIAEAALSQRAMARF